MCIRSPWSSNTLQMGGCGFLELEIFSTALDAIAVQQIILEKQDTITPPTHIRNYKIWTLTLLKHVFFLACLHTKSHIRRHHHTTQTQVLIQSIIHWLKCIAHRWLSWHLYIRVQIHLSDLMFLSTAWPNLFRLHQQLKVCSLQPSKPCLMNIIIWGPKQMFLKPSKQHHVHSKHIWVKISE